MAVMTCSTFAPDLHARTRASGPVTEAIANRGAPGDIDDAATRLLRGGSPPKGPGPFAFSPGLLTTLSVVGLIGLVSAYEDAANAFYAQANTPRAENANATAVLDDAAEVCHARLEEALEELRRRNPVDSWTRDMRAMTLIRHSGDDWRGVIDLALSTLAAKEA